MEWTRFLSLTSIFKSMPGKGYLLDPLKHLQSPSLFFYIFQKQSLNVSSKIQLNTGIFAYNASSYLGYEIGFA